MSIVDLEEVKHHLRYDDDSNDTLNGYIAAAESVIKNYITDTFEADYPAAIKQAVLLLIGYWDQFRNAEGEAPVNGTLPMPVQSLLYPYRKPTAI
jgi:uncharacterized phage protein (predicted DNA packaging)